jgi:hypothetical protein
MATAGTHCLPDFATKGSKCLPIASRGRADSKVVLREKWGRSSHEYLVCGPSDEVYQMIYGLKQS